MRGSAGVSREEATGGSGRWASRPRTLAEGALATAVGAMLVLALGLGAEIFESGPSDRDVHAAYTDGLAVGADTALAAQRAERDAAAQAATAAAAVGGPPDAALGSAALHAWLAARRAREDPHYEALHYPENFPANWNFGVPLEAINGVGAAPVHGSLGPTRSGEPHAGAGPLACDATRCTDANSGFSIPVWMIRGWFDPTRFISDPPPVIAALVVQAGAERAARGDCARDIFAGSVVQGADCSPELK